MGKLSGVFIILMMINVVGFIVLSDYVETYASDNSTGNFSEMQQRIQDSSILQLYTKQTINGTESYGLTNESAMYDGRPKELPGGFLSGVATFIDRIFIVFTWLQLMFAIAVFPLALFSMLGVPTYLSMLIGLPLATLYFMGIIDLFSGGGT